MAGGGIGEAALIGAAVGGGSALLTGNDPLRGALLGGITGGAGGALFGAAGGAAGAAGGAGGAASAAPTVAGATTAGVAGGAGGATGAGVGSALSSASPTFGYTASGLSPFASSASTLPNAVSAVPAATVPSAGFTSVRDLSNSAMNLGGGAADVASGAANKGIMGGLGDWYGSLSMPQKIGLGIAGSTGLSMLSNQQQMPKLGDEGPSFNYDPRKFRPSLPYAEGGIVALAQGGLNNPYISNMGPLDKTVPNTNENSYNQASTNGYLDNSVRMMASGGISSLGGYSDGGRLLKGPGDGMSDHIPASIGDKQPARLADGEFVVPADVVSHLGNGSTDAGAKQLYAMMDRVRTARTGKKSQGKQINAKKHMVA